MTLINTIFLQTFHRFVNRETGLMLGPLMQAVKDTKILMTYEKELMGDHIAQNSDKILTPYAEGNEEKKYPAIPDQYMYKDLVGCNTENNQQVSEPHKYEQYQQESCTERGQENTEHIVPDISDNCYGSSSQDSSPSIYQPNEI